MRKLLIVAVLLLGAQTACTHHRPTPRTAHQPPPSPYEAPRQYVPPPPAPVAARPPAAQQPTWFPRGRSVSQRWTHVVIHHSATDSGSARSFDQFHRGKGWDELGYHFVIGNGSQTADGMVEVGGRWDKQKHGAHCKTPDNYFNDHGIGICLVGDFTDSRPTRKQLTSLYHLVRFLTKTCSIPPERVTTHCAVSHKTQCPGPNFPMQPLRDALHGSNRMAAAY